MKFDELMKQKTINTILRTERLLLRPLCLEDLDRIWPYVSNSEISIEMSWNPHKTKEQTLTFLKDVESAFGRTSYTWAVLFGDKFCGIFSLIAIKKTHRALTYNNAELAYWLGPEFQGKGIMTEAGKAVLKFAFDVLDLNKIFVSHHSVNSNSKKLIERLNFRFLYEEKRAFMKNDEWKDVCHYEVLKSEYIKFYK